MRKSCSWQQSQMDFTKIVLFFLICIVESITDVPEWSRGGLGSWISIGSCWVMIWFCMSACRYKAHIFAIAVNWAFAKRWLYGGSMSATVHTVFDFVFDSSFLPGQDYSHNTTASSFHPPVCFRRCFLKSSAFAKGILFLFHSWAIFFFALNALIFLFCFVF